MSPGETPTAIEARAVARAAMLDVAAWDNHACLPMDPADNVVQVDPTVTTDVNLFPVTHHHDRNLKPDLMKVIRGIDFEHHFCTTFAHSKRSHVGIVSASPEVINKNYDLATSQKVELLDFARFALAHARRLFIAHVRQTKKLVL